MRNLNWPGATAFQKSSRDLYYYESDDKDGEGKQIFKFGGYQKQNGKLHYSIVNAAGHTIQMTQLAMSRQLIKDFTSTDHVLKCYDQDEAVYKCEVKNAMYEALEKCNDQGTVNDLGLCDCRTGFYGADCSVEPKNLVSGTLDIPARNWVTYKVRSNIKY